MKTYYGELLGNTIGKVLDVDVDTNDMGCGSFLRVRVDLNLFKPLARGRMILVLEEELWIPLKYEKIPKFFFGCENILHEKGGCPLKEAPTINQYGIRLRAKVQHKPWPRRGEGE